MAKFDIFDTDYDNDSSFEKFDYTECRDIDILTDELQKYIHSENLVQEIIQAYRFAEEKHREQKRKNGDPFIIHPLSAAYYLAQWRMAPKTVIAGILHDVVEDTPVTYSEIEDIFGDEVANMVEAVTKASYFALTNRETMKANYLLKLMMSSVKDIRVIIIKLADRMHNMLTLKYMRPEKQKIIAKETLDIYAVLAERIGMRTAKNLLENNSFKYLEPEEYAYVAGLIEESRVDRGMKLDEIIDQLSQTIKYEHFLLDTKIFGRTKSVYSIYKKMVFFGHQFQDINDLLAIRIICQTTDECYSILGWIHNMFIPLTGKFKDYIATPKNNMYQSLHTIVSSKQGTIFEVQIRTQEMDEVAERGMAAHWKYKEGIEVDNGALQKEVEQRVELFSRLTNLGKAKAEEKESDLSGLDGILAGDGDVSIDALLNESNTETKTVADDDEIESFSSILTSEELKNEITSQQLYIVTPDSSIVNMPFNSTVIDFAYKIHSDLGNKVIGATINGVFSPINTTLASGELVEIQTSEDAHPVAKWLKIAKTPLAIKEIKKYLAQQEQNEQNDKEISITKQIRTVKKEIDEYIIDNNLKWELNSVEEMEGKVRLLDYNSIDEFLKGVVSGNFTIEEAVKLVYVNKNLGKNEGELTNLRARRFYSNTGRRDVILSNMHSANYSFAKCCFPLPKEEIVGYIDKNELIIHRDECSVIKSKTNVKDIIEAKWNPKPEERRFKYPSKIRIDGEQASHILYKILGVFSSLNIPVDEVKTKSDEDEMTFKCSILAMVSDLMQLKQLINSVQNLPGIERIVRRVEQDPPGKNSLDSEIV